jgi:hypothetical protein
MARPSFWIGTVANLRPPERGKRDQADQEVVTSEFISTLIR